jgi:hydroxylaminobenzene mutase
MNPQRVVMRVNSAELKVAGLKAVYVNWAVTVFAAVFSTSSLSPITGAAYSAQPWQENIVAVAFPTVGIAIIACSVLVLWGLRRKTLG